MIKLEDSAHAVSLCKVLKDSDIDGAEITFRTGGAGESVHLVCRRLEDLCVGAGTVMTVSSKFGSKALKFFPASCYEHQGFLTCISRP